MNSLVYDMSMTLWEEPTALQLDIDPLWEEKWTEGSVVHVYVSTLGGIAVGKDGSADTTLTRGTSWGEIYDAEKHLYLGNFDGTPVFAIMGDHPRQIPLRQALVGLQDHEVTLAIRAAALAQYHHRNRYCSTCGTRTTVTDVGRTRTCDSCGEIHFPRTDPAIIVAVTDESDRLLLGSHVGWEPGRFSVLAGFVEAGESLEYTVVRELREEVGLDVSQITYAGSQPWPMPRSLMVAFTAIAPSQEPIPDLTEIREARWFTRDDLRVAIKTGEITLPMSHSIAYRLITRWYGGPLA